MKYTITHLLDFNEIAEAKSFFVELLLQLYPEFKDEIPKLTIWPSGDKLIIDNRSLPKELVKKISRDIEPNILSYP